jgi:hypothetical protein
LWHGVTSGVGVRVGLVVGLTVTILRKGGWVIAGLIGGFVAGLVGGVVAGLVGVVAGLGGSVALLIVGFGANGGKS